MIYAVVLFVGIITGYALCYFAKGSVSRSKARKHDQEDQDTILVRRSKVSLRSPLKTHRTHYDKFKVRDSGLYSPRKPSGEPMKQKDEIEITG